MHPSTTLDELAEQLRIHAAEIKQRVSPDAPLGIGVWTPAGSHLDTRRFEQVIKHLGLEPITINAFPYHGFHNAEIKHKVYRPSWNHQERSDFTEALTTLFGKSARDLSPISISTLPLAHKQDGSFDMAEAVNMLYYCAHNICEPSKKRPGFSIDLEPEPGCLLERSDDVLRFFAEHAADPEQREVLGICHDICHAAVMYEDQAQVLHRYADAGIRVNKIQISNAIEADFSEASKAEILDALRPFAEDRYLHQTMLKVDGFNVYYEDLPEAIEAIERGDTRPSHLRVHYHVPLYLDRIGPLRTTQNQIMPAIRAARELHDCRHFEIETYAWTVLPDALQRERLADGIADEFRWVLDEWAGREATGD